MIRGSCDTPRSRRGSGILAGDSTSPATLGSFLNTAFCRTAGAHNGGLLAAVQCLSRLQAAGIVQTNSGAALAAPAVSHPAPAASAGMHPAAAAAKGGGAVHGVGGGSGVAAGGARVPCSHLPSGLPAGLSTALAQLSCWKRTGPTAMSSAHPASSWLPTRTPEARWLRCRAPALQCIRLRCTRQRVGRCRAASRCAACKACRLRPCTPQQTCCCLMTPSTGLTAGERCRQATTATCVFAGLRHKQQPWLPSCRRHRPLTATCAPAGCWRVCGPTATWPPALCWS